MLGLTLGGTFIVGKCVLYACLTLDYYCYYCMIILTIYPDLNPACFPVKVGFMILALAHQVNGISC